MNAAQQTAIAPFEFEGRPLRVTEDEHGNPWFHAGDVCAALEHTNPREALRSNVDAEDVSRIDTLTTGGVQSVNHVNDSGLYALIFGSRKPAAKRFKRWVTAEVLPAIRKHGRYIAPAAEQQPEDFATHGQASRLVDHGRVVAAISRTVQAFDRLPAERVDLVNSIASRITGIDTLDLLESEGWQRPAPQASGADPHPWDARVEDWLAEQEADGGWTTDQILIEALGYAPEAIGRSEHTRLGYCLRRLGLTKRRPSEGAARVYRWYRQVH